MSGEVGFGILGSGIMGRTYGEALATQVERGRLTAVALGSRAPQLAEDYGVRLTGDDVKQLATLGDLVDLVATRSS